MARSPRLFIPDAVYHVYCRTARGEMVFSNPEEAREFVDVLADVKRLHARVPHVALTHCRVQLTRSFGRGNRGGGGSRGLFSVGGAQC